MDADFQLIPLLQRHNIPPDDFFICKSKNENAGALTAMTICYGLKRKIFISYDLFENLNVNEVHGVLLHEIAHYKKFHNLIVSLVSISIGVAILILLYMSSRMFLLSDYSLVLWVNLVFIFIQGYYILLIPIRIVIRVNEKLADLFAIESMLKLDLCKALKILYKNKIKYLNAHFLY